MDEIQNQPEADTSANAPPVAVSDEDDVKSEKAGAVPAPAQTAASVFQSLTDKTLHFLSTASNETLGACLAGLGATTYLALGRVGLVIIGVAGGVVLHATWEGIRGESRDEATRKADLERKREAGVEVAKRLLEWRHANKPETSAAEDLRVYANQALDYSSFGPETAAALDTFTDAVIKDYVLYWYDYAIPGEQNFPASCRRTFMAFVLSLSTHLQHKRAADVFLDFVTNASSMFIVFLTELSAALNASPNSPVGEAISTYLKLKPDSSLSYMLDQESQKLKLEDAAEDIIQSYLDPKSYNCPPVHIFLKEVLSKLVLGHTVDMCSNPDWISDWIVYGLEESETTKEVMNIVDASVERRTEGSTPKAAQQVSTKDEPSIKSKKEGVATDTATDSAGADLRHKRQMSRAEEAMDEAMQEAKRLTEMMIEEDRRRVGEEEKRRSTPVLVEDSSDSATQGAPTPSSSQSGQERREVESVTSADFDEKSGSGGQFTSFDQLVPTVQPTALNTDNMQKAAPRPSSAALTLHNASISIFDDSIPGERASIKAKPTTDYLVQIEPSNSSFPGWMIARKYTDFEMLHEVLRRISVITGVRFTESHAELPKWRMHTKISLRTELERYLIDAVKFQPLAESEGMKRFLEKDQGLNKSPGGTGKGFAWPTPDAFGKFGGDMMNVLTKAPKQVVGLVGGSSKRASTSQINLSPTAMNGHSEGAYTPNQPWSSVGESQTHMTDPMTGSYLGSVSSGRESSESLRAPIQAFQEQRRGSGATTAGTDGRPVPSVSPTRPVSVNSQVESISRTEISPTTSTTQLPPLEEGINLPPPPSEMPADYDSPTSPSKKSGDSLRSVTVGSKLSQTVASSDAPPPKPPRMQKGPSRIVNPLSERETAIAVELVFAVITQLYTLSGAWQFRRTLLSAAKTFLLRPGNPQLTSIRDLVQTSLLDANLSDSGLAHQIYKLRENSLPTAEEMEAWKRDYPEKTKEQKEELRAKARKLLVTKGMPQALTSVMGAAASGEALGKVFDCLQMPDVSRGLIFGLVLQALRLVTH